MFKGIQSTKTISAGAVLFLLSACNGNADSLANAGASLSQSAGLTSKNQSTNNTSATRKYKVDALVYAGDAAAFGDPEAISEILDSKKMTYHTVSSSELDSMSLDELSQYGMIIWPGGYAGQMSSSLQDSTREKIRKAVTENGVSYVGICAGAFIAVSAPAKAGAAGPSWGLSLMTNPKDPTSLLPYYHLEDEGTEDAMVNLKMSDGSTRSLVWWGGPYLPEVPKGVIARYEDTKEPAIIQTWAGKGFVILSGPHPEAPDNWRTKLGLTDSDGSDQDMAGNLFSAALNQKPMATLN
jgi:glutamine amidotransferase-like uncharacterized protein